MADCLFCKIIAGEIPSEKVYEDDLVYAMKDIHPVASTHVLVLPKKHYENVLDFARNGDAATALALNKAIAAVAEAAGVAEKGFRVVANCGEHGGQTVPHLHYHVIGGRNLGEKMVF